MDEKKFMGKTNKYKEFSGNVLMDGKLKHFHFYYMYEDNLCALEISTDGGIEQTELLEVIPGVDESVETTTFEILVEAFAVELELPVDKK